MEREGWDELTNATHHQKQELEYLQMMLVTVTKTGYLGSITSCIIVVSTLATNGMPTWGSTAILTAFFAIWELESER
jgi:integral membrane sensor domain MASE1